MTVVRNMPHNSDMRRLFPARKYESGTAWCVWRWTDIEPDYLTLLHIFKTPWFALCLHWIKKADPDPDLHDHPVSFLSIILRGSYLEHVNSMDTPRKLRRFFNWIPATKRHTIDTVFNAPVITLCLMGPKVREWGFHTPEGWVYWRDYSRPGS